MAEGITVADLAGIATAIGTIGLAVVTAILAKQTQSMAAQTQREAELDRKMQVRPYIQVTRARAVSPKGKSTDGALICIRVRNVGTGPAMSVRARVHQEHGMTLQCIDDVRRILPTSFEPLAGNDILAGFSNTLPPQELIVEVGYRSLAGEWLVTSVPVGPPSTIPGDLEVVDVKQEMEARDSFHAENGAPPTEYGITRGPGPLHDHLIYAENGEELIRAQG